MRLLVARGARGTDANVVLPRIGTHPRDDVVVHDAPNDAGVRTIGDERSWGDDPVPR